LEEEWAGHFVSKGFFILFCFLHQLGRKWENPAEPCWLQHPPLHLQKLVVSEAGAETDAEARMAGLDKLLAFALERLMFA